MNSRKAILSKSPAAFSEPNVSIYSARRLGQEVRQRQQPVESHPLIETPPRSETTETPKPYKSMTRFFFLLALSAAAGYFYFDASTPPVSPEIVQAPIVIHQNDQDPIVATLTSEYQTTLQTLQVLRKEIEDLKREKSSARKIVISNEAKESERIAAVTDEMNRMRETLRTLQQTLETKANDASMLRSEIERVASATQDATRAQIQELLKMEDDRLKHPVLPPSPAKEEDLFNAACPAVGARIILAETSRSLQVNPFMSTMGKMLSNFVPNQRFQPLLEQELPGPSVVLDSQAIRGPGDCFCVEGNQLHLSIQLGAPVYGKLIEIEHVRPSLDRHPHFAPDSVKISTYSSRKDEFGLPFSAQEIESIFTDLDFGSQWKVQLKLNARNELIKQVTLTFARAESQSHTCVYRVRLLAGLQSEMR